MKIYIVLLLLYIVQALSKKRKVFKTETIPLDKPLPTDIPNFIKIQDDQQTHILYDQDSFTSERTQKLKTAQKIQDNSLKKAILHSQKKVNFLQNYQQENDYPEIQMLVESNYVESIENQNNKEFFYKAEITDFNEQAEEPKFLNDIERPNIEMRQ